jgi:hypothetical protein
MPEGIGRGRERCRSLPLHPSPSAPDQVGVEDADGHYRLKRKSCLMLMSGNSSERVVLP